MGMTIDLAIEELESTKDYPASDPASDEALDFAIDTMRKYQKIQEIVKEWSESGLLQDKFYDLINEVLEDGNEH